MDRSRGALDVRSDSYQSSAWQFAQTIVGNSSTESTSKLGEAKANRERLEWLIQISPIQPGRLSEFQSAGEEVHPKSKYSAWLSEISTQRDFKPRGVTQEVVDASTLHGGFERRGDSWFKGITEWDEDEHPRRPQGPGGGQWVAKGGRGGGGANTSASPSVLDAIVQRNQAVSGLAGYVSPEMMRANRRAVELDHALRLPGEMSDGIRAGLRTGAKANVNGLATAIRSSATLGLNTNQLELIGVTQQDRDAGYDTAVSISTASGQVLIAVGTGGIASALSKGGSVARAASGALVAYDAAGNAVGVVQGTYDATQNGVNLQNGTQIAGGLLGLKANAKAAGDVKRAYAAAAAARTVEIDRYVAKLPRANTSTSTDYGRYEVRHTGPYNYTLSGGGAEFDIDGYRGPTILDAKHVGSRSSSPYVPESSCPQEIREKILKRTRSELERARIIIESGSTPFKSVEIITNDDSAKRFFEGLLKEMRVPGNVSLQP